MDPDSIRSGRWGSSSMEAKPRMRILTLGKTGAGKSCAIKRFCEGRFVDSYQPTVGVDYGAASIQVGNQTVELDIFDASGHPALLKTRAEFFAYCDAYLLFYDVSDRRSFDGLDDQLLELASNVSEPSALAGKDFVVVGNKIDKSRLRQVTFDEGASWARRRDFVYAESSSSSTADTVSPLFAEVARRFLNGQRAASSSTSDDDGGGGLFSRCTRDQVEALRRVCEAETSAETLQVEAGRRLDADEINRKFRHLSVLLHPDKCALPKCEEAFVKLLASRRAMLERAAARDD